MRSRGLRIIAGQLRGRRIAVPANSSVRPTPERVREALFSILGDRVDGARVLDAFAGSGALGFEALSRGAARVVFLEGDRRVAAGLRANAAALAVEARCEVVEGRLPATPSRVAVGGPFELILADPPYAEAGPEGAAALEALARLLAPGGMLVWERASRGAGPECARLGRARTRRYGNTALDLFEPEPAGADS